MKKRTYTRLTTNQVTASYSYLREPDSGREFSDDKYKVTILIDKADEDGLTIIRNACAKAAADEWPEGAPANMRSPVRDGAEKSAELADYYLVTFKSKQQPKLFDATGAKAEATQKEKRGEGTGPVCVWVRCAVSRVMALSILDLTLVYRYTHTL